MDRGNEAETDVGALECDGELVAVENLAAMAERLQQWLDGKRFAFTHSRSFSDGRMMAELYEQARLSKDFDLPIFYMQGDKALEEIHVCVWTHEVRYYWLTIRPCYPGVAPPQRRRTDITFGENQITIKCRSVGGTIPRPLGEPEVFPGLLVVYTFTVDTRASL